MKKETLIIKLENRQVKIEDCRNYFTVMDNFKALKRRYYELKANTEDPEFLREAELKEVLDFKYEARLIYDYVTTYDKYLSDTSNFDNIPKIFIDFLNYDREKDIAEERENGNYDIT